MQPGTLTFLLLVHRSLLNVEVKPRSILFSLLVFAASSLSAFAEAKLAVDWPAFLAQEDPLWTVMPKSYYEGPFVGNGLVGTIVFQDDKEPNTLRFEIGRTDVYDHRTSGYAPVGRLPIGQLLLTPTGTIQRVDLRTDLWNAEIRGKFTTSAGTLEFRCYAPSGTELIVLNIKPTGGEKNAKLAFRPEQGNHPRPTVQPARDKGQTYTPNPPFIVEKRGGIEVVTQPLLCGDDYATAWSEQTAFDGSRQVLVTVANLWAQTLTPAKGSADAAVATLQKYHAADLAAVEKQHRDWWHRFYPASFVTLPDAKLESFYWIQLYKLGSATHPGCPAIDLMGPWFRKSVWAMYWLNLNLQLAYYTTGTTNHLDLAEPLYGLIEKRTNDLITNVPKPYQVDCAGLSGTVGYGVLNGHMLVSEDPSQRLSLIALPWLMQEFYLHNRVTMDDERLRTSIFPLMKRTFQVYVHVMKKGEDGKYHVPYAFSDEYGNAHDTSLNLALATWGFRTLLEINDRLKLNDPEALTWKEMLDQMAGFPTDQNGIRIGADQGFDKPHRHYSHLFAIFPLYTLNVENHPDQIPLMKTSINRYIDLDGDNCMFKFTGAASLWAALGDGDTALKSLQRSLVILLPKNEPSVGPNTLYSEHGWPTFESPIASSRAILDMLMQDWGRKIRIFPACPSSWNGAAFTNFRAQGGFLVSAVRKGRKTQWVKIKSLAGEPCTLVIDGKPQSFTLAKGEEREFGSPPNVIEPLPHPAAEQNTWGMRAELK